MRSWLDARHFGVPSTALTRARTHQKRRTSVTDRPKHGDHSRHGGHGDADGDATVAVTAIKAPTVARPSGMRDASSPSHGGHGRHGGHGGHGVSRRPSGWATPSAGCPAEAGQRRTTISPSHPRPRGRKPTHPLLATQKSEEHDTPSLLVPLPVKGRRPRTSRGSEQGMLSACTPAPEARHRGRSADTESSRPRAPRSLSRCPLCAPRCPRSARNPPLLA